MGVPGAALGVDNDVYTDTASGYEYQKVAGAWVFRLAKKGAAGTTPVKGTDYVDGEDGIDGTQVYSESYAPGPTTGGQEGFLWYHLKSLAAYDMYKYIDGQWILVFRKAEGATTPTPSALAATLTISAASVAAGTAVAYTAGASGGTAPYSYAVTATNTATGATVSIGSAATGNWTPSAAGSYDIASTVTDAVNATKISPVRNLTVTAAAATTLAAPADPLATPTSSTALNVAASSVANATGYKLFRSPASGGAFVQVGGTLSSPSYADTGLSASTTYYYKWQALGNGTTYADSPQGAQFSGTTQAATAPPTGSVNQFRISYPGQSNEHSQGLKAPFLAGGHLAGITPAITREFQRSMVANGSAVQKLQMGVNDYSSGATATGHPNWFGAVVPYSQAWENAGPGMLATARYSLDGTDITKFTKQGAPVYGGGFDNSAYNEIKRQILLLKEWWLAQGLPLTSAEVVWDCNQGETWADLPNWGPELAQIWADLKADCGLPDGGRESVTLTQTQTDSHDNTQARANIQAFADSRPKCLAVDAIGYNLHDNLHHWDAFSHLKHGEEKVKALNGQQPTRWYISAVQSCGANTTGTPKQAASTVSKAQANADATALLVCTPTGGGTPPATSDADPDYPYLTRKKQEFTADVVGIAINPSNTMTATAGANGIQRYAKTRFAIGPSTANPLIGYIEWQLTDAVGSAQQGLNTYLFGVKDSVPVYSNDLDDLTFASYVKVSTGNNGVNGFGVNLYTPGNNPGYDMRAGVGDRVRIVFTQTKTQLVKLGATRAQDIILFDNYARAANGATLYQIMSWLYADTQVADIYIGAASLVTLA
ncbi:hypothetical protein [Hymenobacter yonginensis]|uniref:Fibronectin type-III domain-containing protein n=1 Tax=Hymenobacter yonginensis TaxID=748197 RepID=A0ABY7PT28_9BACT|nr:hypothetical protein [Hymenobacter yonginensis]WBO86065.1 hypothetical protein O9Z63_07370 [Hymenobacter yonginensis]